MSFGGGGYGRGGYDDGGGGGFMMGSQQASQGGGGGGGRNYQDDTLRPLTIKQILEGTISGDSAAETRIDGAVTSQVTIVGQIRTLNPQQTVFNIRLDDGTGTIDVKKYIDPDKHDDVMAGLEVDTYVRVWGKLKPFNGKQFIQAQAVRPVESHNEVNCHMLEASYVHLYMTRGPPGGGGGGMGGGDGGHGGDSMFVDSGGDHGMGMGGGGDGIPPHARAFLNSCSPAARKMYMYLQKASQRDGMGLHLQMIANGASMSVRDVMNASSELVGGGLVFTTTDDETWEIL